MTEDKKTLIIRQIPADIRRELKIRAAMEGKSQQALVIEIITRYLRDRESF